jgi:hypothetical protein
MFEVDGAMTGAVLRVGGDVACLPRLAIEVSEDTEILAGVDHIRVPRFGLHVTGFAATDVEPLALRDAAAFEGVGRARRGAQVLHGAEHAIGDRRVGGHMVELGERKVRGEPGLARVGAHRNTSVVGQDHARGIFGIDPRVVEVAMVRGHALDGLAAIDGFEQRHLGEPHDVGVRGIDGDGRVVPGALTQSAVGIRQGE